MEGDTDNDSIVANPAAAVERLKEKQVPEQLQQLQTLVRSHYCMVEDGAQTQMSTGIWREACTYRAFAFSNGQKVALLFHTRGSKGNRNHRKRKGLSMG